jgi:hypothetical protein
MQETGEPEAQTPHDILAAEAFAVGAPDPGLQREEAHDVLAADEFPVPAPQPHAVPPGWGSAGGAGLGADPVEGRRRISRVALAASAACGLLALRRRRRRRRSS